MNYYGENYYDGILSYYRIIVCQMIKENPNISEDIAREAFNYYMNSLSLEDRKRIINEMRQSTGLLEMLISKPINTDLIKTDLGIISSCVESIIICFANGALLPVPAFFEKMHEYVLEATGYRGIFEKMDLEYQYKYIRG